MWPRIRAAAIALVIAIGVIEGLPLSNEPDKDGPILGMVRWARKKALVPFAWIGRDASIQQKWRLFPGASANRYRLEVAGLTPAGWQLLYRIGDDTHDAYGAMLEFRRVRGAWNPRSRGVVGQYHAFVKWFAALVLDDHPEMSAVRVQMQRIRIEDGSVTELGGDPAFPVVHARQR
jgi:hypothetical protein